MNTIDAMKQAREEIEAIWRLAAIGPDHLSKTGATHLFSARSLLEEAVAAEEAKLPLSAERDAPIKRAWDVIDVLCKAPQNAVTPLVGLLKELVDMLAADAQHGYTAADMSEAHAKGYALGLAQVDRPAAQQVAVIHTITDPERTQALELKERHEDTEILNYLDTQFKKEEFAPKDFSLRQHVRDMIRKSNI